MTEQQDTAATAASTANGNEATEETQRETPQGEGLPESIQAILEKERKAARDADRRARAAEKKAQEYEDREKTEAERAQSAAERATARAEDAEKRLIRMQVALEKKIPADLMEFLSGETRQEVEAKADALLAHLKPRDAVDFDSGVREAVQERLTPEQEHQNELLNLFRAHGKLPAT